MARLTVDRLEKDSERLIKAQEHLREIKQAGYTLAELSKISWISASTIHKFLRTNFSGQLTGETIGDAVSPNYSVEIVERIERVYDMFMTREGAGTSLIHGILPPARKFHYQRRQLAKDQVQRGVALPPSEAWIKLSSQSDSQRASSERKTVALQTLVVEELWLSHQFELPTSEQLSSVESCLPKPKSEWQSPPKVELPEPIEDFKHQEDFGTATIQTLQLLRGLGISNTTLSTVLGIHHAHVSQLCTGKQFATRSIKHKLHLFLEWLLAISGKPIASNEHNLYTITPALLQWQKDAISQLTTLLRQESETPEPR